MLRIRSTLQSVSSKLKASGMYRHVQIGEYESPPIQKGGGGLAAAVYMQSADIPVVELDVPTEIHVLQIRIYATAFANPAKQTEIALTNAVNNFASKAGQEYDLGATIRNVDFAGQFGESLGAEYGYAPVADVMYRVADITVPCIVNGDWGFTQ